MRDKNKPASLNEMMGNGPKHVSLDNLHEHLGAIMPELEFNQVGKLRLLHSLQQRFGQNYRAIPGVNKTISDFDRKIEMHKILNRGKY